MFDKKSINWRHLLLGILLNVLVIIAFLLIYHAYVVSPKLEKDGTGARMQQIEKVSPTGEAN